MALWKRILFVSHCVFHVSVSFPLCPPKRVLLFKAPKTFNSWKLFYFASRLMQKWPFNVNNTHTDISKWAMPHVYQFFLCFCCFSLHSNCSEIWGLSSPNTIEQWDTSGLYNYPDQTRWLSSSNCMVSYTVLIWAVCPSVPLWRTGSRPFSLLTPLLSILRLFTVQSDPWTVVCRSPNVKGFLTSFTVACGGGRTSTATTSYVPLRPVSMPSTSKRMRCASTLTTTKG